MHLIPHLHNLQMSNQLHLIEHVIFQNSGVPFFEPLRMECISPGRSFVITFATSLGLPFCHQKWIEHFMPNVLIGPTTRFHQETREIWHSEVFPQSQNSTIARGGLTSLICYNFVISPLEVGVHPLGGIIVTFEHINVFNSYDDGFSKLGEKMSN